MLRSIAGSSLIQANLAPAMIIAQRSPALPCIWKACQTTGMDQYSRPQMPSDDSSLSLSFQEITCIEDEGHDIDSEEIRQGREELEKWQRKIDKVEKEKSELTCEKLDADKLKRQALNELSKLNIEQESHKNKREKMEQAFKIKIKLPETNMKLTRSEQCVLIDQEGDEFLNIKGIYTIFPKMSVLLQDGQALITFEEEQVADRIIKIAKHHIDFQSEKVHVKAQPITLDTTPQFEIHLDISMKMVRISDIPEILPEEQMRDKLELSFSKPSLGGGEVENIEYSPSFGTAVVTFVEKGIAQHVAKQKNYFLEINGVTYQLTVEPVIVSDLEKFQIFNGICKKTVLLSDIKSSMEEEELKDKLMIHFQKPSKQGGEVEHITYVPKDKHLLVYFKEDSAEK
ncbi:N-myc-interactor-like isoform X3 [Narcine bancroftii]|uniref:N-myc-interactor-like isoform X3 n=1 Tax=Narcine bancroftii TaxID=1343680 RepID=UPI0038312A71